jgi:DNA-binding CsgD family transcriptional regulator
MGPAKHFTPSQLRVMAQLKDGKSNKLIARNLRLCEATVKLHVRQIMRKLGASNRTQVAIYCSTDGAVESILRADGEGIAANNETGDEEAPLLPNGRSDTGLS